MADKEIYLEILERTENQFKFIIAAKAACNLATENFLEYFDQLNFGKHSFFYDELYLSPEDEKIAVATLEDSTTHIITLQLDRILEIFIGGERFTHSDLELATASLIIRQIRNAFAHDPFNPTWKIGQPQAKNKILKIDNVLTLDTKNIDGKRMEKMDYGGPLSILKLSRLVREKLLSTPHNNI
jgi:hypothetical protein